MQHMRFRIACLMPLALVGIGFGSGPAFAQTTPPTGPGGADEANQTRRLESEIEDYPGPNDGVRDDAEPTRIPEAIHPAPKPPSRSPGPHAGSPAARPNASASSAIDPSEVERVMGSDAGVVSLTLLEPGAVQRLQARLHQLGHYQGPIDGVVGPKTRAALEAYTHAQFTLKQRLIRHDQLTSDLARQLGIGAREPSEGGEPFLRDDTTRDEMGPSMRKDTPLLPPGGAPLPPGGAPLPPPGIAPQPTPSSLPPRAGSTPPAPRPAP